MSFFLSHTVQLNKQKQTGFVQKVQQIYIRLINMNSFLSCYYWPITMQALFNLDILLSFHLPFEPISAFFYNYRSATFSQHIFFA